LQLQYGKNVKFAVNCTKNKMWDLNVSLGFTLYLMHLEMNLVISWKALLIAWKMFCDLQELVVIKFHQIIGLSKSDNVNIGWIFGKSRMWWIWVWPISSYRWIKFTV